MKCKKEDDTNKDRQPRYDIDHIYLYYHITKGLGMMWGTYDAGFVWA